LVTATCGYCNQKFEPSVDAQKYCSRKHKKRAREKRHGLSPERQAEKHRYSELAICQRQAKVPYETITDARIAAGGFMLYEDRVLYPYECACGSWHLTSTPPSRGTG
jgi:hypothetical protein